MADLIDLLLGLDDLSWSKRDLRLAWHLDLPAWAWAAVALVATGLAVWSYSRLIGPRAARYLLATVRTLLLVLIAVLIAGPSLILTRERVEPDWLLVLVDRSASMTIRDTTGSTQGANPAGRQWITRDAALRAAIQKHRALFSEEKLGKNRRLLWLGFDADLYPIPEPDADASLPDPNGHSSNLRSAIERALQTASGNPICGIVAFTDGRTPQATGTELIRHLQGQAVSVFPVPLGSAIAPLDLRLARVDAPDTAFVNDTVPITVWIQTYPQDARVDPQRVRVRLINDATGETLDEQTGPAGGLTQPIQLTGGSTTAGPVRWRVEVQYDPPPTTSPDTTAPEDTASAPGQAQLSELVTDNNQQQFQIQMLGRPLAVLYIEGYPRWEYRYLKNLLIREKSIESSIMLLSADRGFAQEGDRPIQRLPLNMEEIRPYDVVILGDVPVRSLSPEQLTLLRDHVALNGAGLLWIAGPFHTARSYDATPLADILPMRRPGATREPTPDHFPVHLTPTALARSLNVLRLSQEAPDNESKSSWPAHLPPFWWVQDTRPLKPSAEVIADAPATTETENTEQASLPLITRLRYAKGQSLYVATDETWRWRYAVGDTYFERFWLQLIRMLGRHRVQQNQNQTRLTVSNPRVELGRPLVVELTVEEATLVGHDLSSVSVTVTRDKTGTSDEGTSIGGSDTESPAPSSVIEQLELLKQRPPERSDAALEAGPQPSNRGTQTYQTIWNPSAAGTLRLNVDQPALADLELNTSVEVIHPGDELRNPLPDHDRLATIAKETGGRVVPLAQLDELATLVPNRARRTPDDISESLWDSPLSLFLVVGLLTMEWICRKIIQLA